MHIKSGKSQSYHKLEDHIHEKTNILLPLKEHTFIYVLIEVPTLESRKPLTQAQPRIIRKSATNI